MEKNILLRKIHPCACALTVAALTAESLLEACGPIHTRFTTWNHDLVWVWFGAARDAQQVRVRVSV